MGSSKIDFDSVAKQDKLKFLVATSAKCSRERNGRAEGNVT